FFISTLGSDLWASWILHRKTLNLWGGLAIIKGKTLKNLESAKPVVTFCDVKGSICQ
ncbi:hypothetical protein HAX54_028315, partial [Datura stramonium]|nr:hypothetical protein [Datura stramonium]